MISSNYIISKAVEVINICSFCALGLYLLGIDSELRVRGLRLVVIGSKKVEYKLGCMQWGERS